MPTRILAQRYNALQNTIKKVLGAPLDATPNFGYNQVLKSSRVSANTTKIRSSDYTNLVADMSRARYHQIGSAFAGIDPVIPAGVNREKVYEAYITQLESLMPLIEADAELAASSQTTVENVKNSAGANLNSSISTAWNGSIQYTFDLNFSSKEHYRSFFNTSGEIRLTSVSSYSGTEAKSLEWKSALNYISTIRFTKTQTIAANGAIVNSTGGRDLSVNNSVVLINTGNFSSPYSSNRIKLEVNKTSVSSLRFTVTLTDAAVTWPTVDENVKGTITTTVSLVRASGSLSKIDIPAPVGTNIETYAPQLITVNYEIIGGGGAGGFGVNDGGEGFRGTYAPAGTSSSITGSGIATITAAGGTGGENCGLGRGSTGGNGQASVYGPGGAGGARNSSGQNAPLGSYGAGGGGGGGDSGSTYDAGGCAGIGGNAGTRLTGTINVLSGTTISVTIGVQGVAENRGYKGGNGQSGYCKLTYSGITKEFTQSGGTVIQ